MPLIASPRRKAIVARANAPRAATPIQRSARKKRFDPMHLTFGGYCSKCSDISRQISAATETTLTSGQRSAFRTEGGQLNAETLTTRPIELASYLYKGPSSARANLSGAALKKMSGKWEDTQ